MTRAEAEAHVGCPVRLVIGPTLAHLAVILAVAPPQKTRPGQATPRPRPQVLLWKRIVRTDSWRLGKAWQSQLENIPFTGSTVVEALRARPRHVLLAPEVLAAIAPAAGSEA